MNVITPDETFQLFVPTTINVPGGEEAEALNTQNGPSCHANAIQQARGGKTRRRIMIPT